MKIHKLILKESEIREVDGEYEEVFFNEKTYPIYLSNYALKKGKEMGLIESSLFTDLLKMYSIKTATDEEGNVNPESIDPSALASLDETKAQKVIYLAFLGGNKKIEMTFDEFLELYHYTVVETLELYMELIVGLIDDEPNKFAQGLQKSEGKSKDKKKQKRPFWK